MSLTPEQLDAYHDRIGVKPANHAYAPGTNRAGRTTGCSVCPMSEQHRVHQGAQVISMAQFRSRR